MFQKFPEFVLHIFACQCLSAGLIRIAGFARGTHPPWHQQQRTQPGVTVGVGACVSEISGILYDACRWWFPKDLDVAVRTTWSRAASIAVTEFLPALPTGAQTSSCSCASCMSSTSRRGTTHTCLQDCAMHWSRIWLCAIGLRTGRNKDQWREAEKVEGSSLKAQQFCTISHQKQ